jgi:SPX domain protein involved in polyphosphate accumulation
MVKAVQLIPVLQRMIKAGHLEWCENGQDIRIVDRENFYSTIVGQFTQCEDATSFKRNMNNYGFYKVRRSHEKLCRRLVSH